MALTIRGRLTLWYTAVLLALLVLFGTWVYLVESHLGMEDIDAALDRTAAAVAAGLATELDEGTSLAEAAPEVYRDFAAPGTALAIHDDTGFLLAGDTLPAIEIDPLREGEGVSATVTRHGKDWRLRAGRHRHEAAAYDVVVAEPLARAYAATALVRRALLVGIPIALGLAASGGWWIARRALRPVSLMVGQARRITDHTSGFRLKVPHPEDELGMLARAFNELLDRLEGALLTQRRFMADASHELRTPLSIVRTTAEVTLGRERRSEQEYREALEGIHHQARRLGRMVDDMMTLARADAAGLTLEAAEVYLDEILSECARDAAVLARERRIEVRIASAPETRFRGDERLLRQMLMNLLDNAIRHTPPGGCVEARLTPGPRSVEIAVRDTGSGVPPEQRERIFERFVRLDPARGRPGGSGLGLPIARCIAEGHGGTIDLAESDSSGSTFLVRLPLPEPVADQRAATG